MEPSPGTFGFPSRRPQLARRKGISTLSTKADSNKRANGQEHGLSLVQYRPLEKIVCCRMRVMALRKPFT